MNEDTVRPLGHGFPRYLVSVATGLCVTLLLFLLMQRLIEGEASSYAESPSGVLLSFVRLLDEPPPLPKDRVPPRRVVERPPRVETTTPAFQPE